MSVLFGQPEKRHANLSMFQQSTVIPRNSETGTGNTGRLEWSLQKVAVWFCMNLTATMAEVMPLESFDGEGPNKAKIPLTRWMLDLGGDGYGLPDWRYQAVMSAMGRGNVIGVVPDGMRDARTGTPTMVQIQHPDDIRVHEPYGADPPIWYGRGGEIKKSQLWHKRVHPVPGRLLGASPIEYGANTVSLGVATTEFGLMWFLDGAHPSGLLTTDARLDEKQAKTAKDRFMAALRGRREPAVLGQGWKYQTIQVKPNESQFLETQGFTSAECCRLFGPGFAQLAGYSTGEALTYANIEQRSLDVLIYAVDPWLVRLETWLTSLLPAGRNVKFNRKGLLRTDLLTRMRAHEIALRNRMGTVNEARAEEDLPPLPGGDEPPAIAAPAPAPTPVSVEGP